MILEDYLDNFRGCVHGKYGRFYIISDFIINGSLHSESYIKNTT
jgi:hypothetical protein